MSESGPRRAADLTGELPRFVRDALGRARPVDDADRTPDAERAADEADADTVGALVALGVDEPEAAEAVRRGHVPLVLARRVVGDEPRYTLDEIAARSGVDAALLREVRVASGLPVPERFSERDLTYAHLLARLLEVLPPDAVVRSARARGTALSTIVRSDLGAVRDQIVLPMRRDGADDLTVATAMAETATRLEGLARELLEITYGLHLEHELGSAVAASMTHAEGQEIDLAVGFVDVVGWTGLSARIDPAGLDAVLDTFESRVVDVVSADSEVGVVKYVGDAVMLVGPDPASLAEVLLELTEPVADLDDAPLRAGMASGAVRVREGDYYGTPVNLAARLTDLARAWRVLADEDLAGDLGAFETRRLRPTRIRGVGMRRPLAVLPAP